MISETSRPSSRRFSSSSQTPQSKPFRNKNCTSTNTWLQSEPAGPAALRAIALGQLVVTKTPEPAPAAEFLQELESVKKDSSQSFELLMKRYACPLNFSYAMEDGVREFILERLMVVDRRRIEEDSPEVADTDYLWHRLNLIAIHSQVSADLRFLDALNYYFELIPSDWRSRAQDNWLMVSYLALYARALASHCDDL